MGGLLIPTYLHRCDNGHEFDLLLKFDQLEEHQHCSCGRPAFRVICAPMMVKVDNIAYQSPVDGRAITTKQQRIEDLKRNNCIEYDPGMKQDYQRRVADSERSLDRAVDDYVDRTISQMAPRKREKLNAELAGGVTAEPTRLTPPQRSANG